MSHISDASPIPTPAQCRAARAALGMTILEAAAATAVSHASLVNIEKGKAVRASVMDRLREALEAQGVTFAPDGQGITWRDSPSASGPA